LQEGQEEEEASLTLLLEVVELVDIGLTLEHLVVELALNLP
jgi:hypothetical protein